mmetsp:Transcript_2307/g.9917  ORF Transcript_2307/g.9917 Transcript_2307/m.9917 type:complete len:206 (-) Transcript_2307:148-765(-)
MLAPRRKLWSTPMAVVEQALELLDLSSEDVVLDLGSGDGRFLLECAKQSGARCVGIEIEEARVEAARRRVEEEGLAELVELRVGNILDVNPEMVSPSAVFAYLCPRGYRKILPLIESLAMACETPPLRVVTYMAGFPAKDAERKALVTPPHQPSAQWPVFLYHFDAASSNTLKDGDGDTVDVAVVPELPEGEGDVVQSAVVATTE